MEACSFPEAREHHLFPHVHPGPETQSVLHVLYTLPATEYMVPFDPLSWPSPLLHTFGSTVNSWPCVAASLPQCFVLLAILRQGGPWPGTREGAAFCPFEPATAPRAHCRPPLPAFLSLTTDMSSQSARKARPPASSNGERRDQVAPEPYAAATSTCLLAMWLTSAFLSCLRVSVCRITHEHNVHARVVIPLLFCVFARVTRCVLLFLVSDAQAVVHPSAAFSSRCCHPTYPAVPVPCILPVQLAWVAVQPNATLPYADERVLRSVAAGRSAPHCTRARRHTACRGQVLCCRGSLLTNDVRVALHLPPCVGACLCRRLPS